VSPKFVDDIHEGLARVSQIQGSVLKVVLELTLRTFQYLTLSISGDPFNTYRKFRLLQEQIQSINSVKRQV